MVLNIKTKVVHGYRGFDPQTGAVSFPIYQSAAFRHLGLNQSTRLFMKNVKTAVAAVSLGGVETIVSYPVKMSHASVPMNIDICCG